MVRAMPATKRTTPAGELGAPGIVASLDGWLDTYETTLQLRWPNSVATYDAMRNDAHLEGGLDALHLPIRRSNWNLTEDSLDGVRPEVVDLVRRDLGLPEEGKRLVRPRGGIDLGDVIRHALLQDVFGHMVFEQVYDLERGDGLAHLAKLGPRMPRTIQGWDLDPHGGLQAIKQLIPLPNGMWDYVVIPIDRLVVFTRQKEGSDPTGRSILRSCYIHWELKQKLMRVDAIAAERNGMGIAQVDFDPSKLTRKEALDIASNTRTGEYAGVAFEDGAGNLTLKGVEGQVREIIESIKYHDQEMSRRMLAMFMDLGQDNGARSLGETFVDFFVMAQQTSADYVAGILNEHVIRDLVEVNWGPDEPYPLIACDEITSDSDLTAESLLALSKGGYIRPDQTLEDFLRKRYRFPINDNPDTPTPPGPPPPPAGTAVVPVGDVPAPGGTVEHLEAELAMLKAGPRRPPSRVPSGP